MIGKDAKKSRAPFIIGILAVCLAGAAFGAVKFLERSLVNRFNEAAARIPASYGLSIGEVAGNAFSRSVTLKRVALRIPETNFSVSMDNATIAGLSFSGNSGDGPDTLADELTITNLQIAGGYVTSSSEYLSITGFKSNLPKLAANWQESVEGSARFLEQLARTALVNGPPAPVTKKNEKMPALHLFAERYVSRGDRFRIERDGNVLEAFSGSTEAGDLSPEAFGPMLYKDIWVAYNGRRFLAIREAGFDGGAFPPESDAPQDASDVVLGRNPFGDDFRLKKAVLRDATLTVDLPDGETSPVFLKEAGLDMDFTDKRQQVTLSADQLTVAKKLLLAKKTDLGIASEMGALAGYLPETIIAGGQVTMDVSVPGGNSLFLSFSPFALSVQDLGTCVVRAAIHGPADMKGDVSISLLEVELTDAGASDILFALIGKGQGKTPEFFRREIRMGLSTAGFTLSGPLAKLNTDVLDFLEKPGATLSVKFAPGRPVKPEEVEEMLLRDPESAGLSSTLTRPDASQGG